MAEMLVRLKDPRLKSTHVSNYFHIYIRALLFGRPYMAAQRSLNAPYGEYIYNVYKRINQLAFFYNKKKY